MNRSKISILILVILLIISILVVMLRAFYIEYVKQEQLEIAEEIVTSNQQNQVEVITKEELEINKNVIGLLEIPKINLIAPIQEGTSQEVLKVAVGHFSESSYWNGNVALASHNRSQYVHYFEKINELQVGDEIIYKTKYGSRIYKVYENNIIDETDWSVIENTSENIITLITCINNEPEKRLCVRGEEVL